MSHTYTGISLSSVEIKYTVSPAEGGFSLGRNCVAVLLAPNSIKIEFISVPVFKLATSGLNVAHTVTLPAGIVNEVPVTSV